MSSIQFVQWNMEWLDDLFLAKDAGRVGFRPDAEKPQHDQSTTVGDRKAAIKQALSLVEADVLVVVEGPSTGAEFQLLFDELGPGRWVTHLQESKSKNGPQPGATSFTSLQNVGIAVRTDSGKFAATPITVFDSMAPASGDIFTASEPFYLDSTDRGIAEWFRFERRPAYAEIRLADGKAFRVVGVHFKSKGIFDALEWSKWWQKADANRERILAQCRHFREAFIAPYLQNPATKDIPLIVCGDINDGPGFDTSEMRLLASGVETLMGSVWEPQTILGSALFDRLPASQRAKLDFEDNYTTRFKDPIFEGVFQKEWIDHILYSRRGPDGWVNNASVIREVAADPSFRLYKVSDHYPVTATISL